MSISLYRTFSFLTCAIPINEIKNSKDELKYQYCKNRFGEFFFVNFIQSRLDTSVNGHF